MPNKKLPLKKNLLNAMAVAENSIGGVEYLEMQFKELLVALNLSDKAAAADVAEKMENFVQYVRFKFLSNAQPWLGQSAVSTGFKQMQANMANAAAKSLEQAFGRSEETIQFDFAVSEKGEFMRGYSSAEIPLKPDSIESFDKLLNAWFAENNIVNQDKFLYQCDANGQIELDKEGNKVTVTPEKLKDLIADPEQGLERYLQARALNLISKNRPFPSDQQQEKTQQAVQNAITDAGVNLANEEEPVEPQPGPSQK